MMLLYLIEWAWSPQLWVEVPCSITRSNVRWLANLREERWFGKWNLGKGTHYFRKSAFNMFVVYSV